MGLYKAVRYGRFVMRRYSSRLLRLRNLVAVTFVLFVLYVMKTWNESEIFASEQSRKIALAELSKPITGQSAPIIGQSALVIGQSAPVIGQSAPVIGEKALVIGQSAPVIGQSALVIEHSASTFEHNAPVFPAFVLPNLEKKDYHNYTEIAKEARRVGVGEQGRPAYLPKEDKALEDKLYFQNGFNGALSDKIALNRSIPDIRHHLCRKRLYLKSLPTVSVVVPFHDEHWSTLLRTATSVFNRSPPHLLKEMVLVDDGSTKEFLKDKLEQYLSRHLPKARVIRLKQRRGLITARLAGALEVTGDVLVFLDSHTEANVNWLPPLLEPIALNYRTAVCPFIDVVAYDTFEYRPQDEGARGAFDWEFFYKRLPLLPVDEMNMPQPFASPVMAGGLFAISRAFFWELGGYDPGLDIWGGEQYELSFKIWQCGGRMLDAPCSRVGHIYRKFAPFPDPNHGDFVAKNYRRVAEVWMDEYAQYLYKRRPHYLNVPTGDISEQVALRKKLKCKSFRWYMTQVAFDLTANYPVEQPKSYGGGRVRPKSDLKLCVDAHNGVQGDSLRLTACRHAEREQEFDFTWHKDVRCKDRGMCWDLPESRPGSPVLLHNCHQAGGNQEWRYDPETGQIKKSELVCLDFGVPTRSVFVKPCKRDSETQKWMLDRMDRKLMEQWHSMHLRVTAPEIEVKE